MLKTRLAHGWLLPLSCLEPLWPGASTVQAGKSGGSRMGEAGESGQEAGTAAMQALNMYMLPYVFDQAIAWQRHQTPLYKIKREQT